MIVGAGYIAVELAGMFSIFGCETAIAIRNETLLREFDPTLASQLTDHMKQGKIVIHNNTKSVSRVVEVVFCLL